ncbi:hypothetical protein H4Q26_012119 [Puccinia striiformis f. sp. tritici PST-130]|nr:hypothetical protein H4Q26_012119 [Puccinia striiformis f. sp. tritici PST-130]
MSLVTIWISSTDSYSERRWTPHLTIAELRGTTDRSILLDNDELTLLTMGTRRAQSMLLTQILTPLLLLANTTMSVKSKKFELPIQEIREKISLLAFKIRNKLGRFNDDQNKQSEEECIPDQENYKRNIHSDLGVKSPLLLSHQMKVHYGDIEVYCPERHESQVPTGIIVVSSKTSCLDATLPIEKRQRPYRNTQTGSPSTISLLLPGLSHLQHYQHPWRSTPERYSQAKSKMGYNFRYHTPSGTLKIIIGAYKNAGNITLGIPLEWLLSLLNQWTKVTGKVDTLKGISNTVQLDITAPTNMLMWQYFIGQWALAQMRMDYYGK